MTKLLVGIENIWLSCCEMGYENSERN